MRVFKAGNKTINMCDYCVMNFAECPHNKHFECGEDDNIIECSGFEKNPARINVPVLCHDDRTQPPPDMENKPPHYLLQFFEYKHLPVKLQEISSHYYGIAYLTDKKLPDNPEKTTALRKLLEAKDCAVRAVIFKKD